MAVGDVAAGGKPRKVISTTGREAEAEVPAAPAESADPAAPAAEAAAAEPLLKQADPEFEKLLDAEEEIERKAREQGGGDQLP